MDKIREGIHRTGKQEEKIDRDVNKMGLLRGADRERDVEKDGDALLRQVAESNAECAQAMVIVNPFLVNV